MAYTRPLLDALAEVAALAAAGKIDHLVEWWVTCSTYAEDRDLSVETRERNASVAKAIEEALAA